MPLSLTVRETAWSIFNGDKIGARDDMQGTAGLGDFFYSIAVARRVLIIAVIFPFSDVV